MTITQERLAVLVQITEPGSAEASAVVSAAAQLFTAADPVDVVLWVPGNEEASEEDAALVSGWVFSSVDDPASLPEIQLLGDSEVGARSFLATITAGGGPAAAARSIALLTGLSLSLQERTPAPPAPVAPQLDLRENPLRERARALRQRSDAAVAVARQDLERASRLGFERRPRVAVVFQHRGYWSSVERLCAALRDHPGVDFTLVALDSGVDDPRTTTASFLSGQGWAPQDGAWLLAELHELDAVVFDNPYDEMRAFALRVPELADRGVRLVDVPYGNGAIAGELMDKLLWDLPLQRVAWRTYLADPSQRRVHDELCLAGSSGVRVLGSAKQDRTLAHVPGAAAGAIRSAARGRRVVLWNPHFRIGPGGWSTFVEHVGPLLQHARTHPDLFLVVRPHFRLLPLLEHVGGDVAQLGHEVRSAPARLDNVWLDEHDDYLEAFSVADALISDLSSLATEFLLTGRPVLHLNQPAGPGPNAAGDHFAIMERADSWEDVEQFLGRVLRGEDPLREVRRAEVARAFPYADGRASVRIADDIVSSLVEELRLSPPGAPAPQRGHVALASARLTADALVLGDATTDGEVEVALVAGSASTAWVPVVGATTRLPLVQGPGPGEGRVMPLGRYRLAARSRGVEVPVEVGAAGVEQRVEDRTAGERLELRGEGAGLELRVTRRSQATRTTAPTGLREAVLLTSYGGAAAACSPLAIARELVRQDHPAEIAFAVADSSVVVPDGVRPVLLGSPEHQELAATARWHVSNEAVDATWRKRPGQVLLQTWHGTPLKKLRRDLHVVSPRNPQVLAECERDAAQWDHVLSPNPFTTQVLRRGFRATGTIHELGYPRNDLLSDPVRSAEAAARVRATYCIPDGHRVVLYAPTWRDNALSGLGAGAHAHAQPELDWRLTRSVVGDDVTFLVRNHRFLPPAVRERPAGVVDVTTWPDMTDLLAAADVLVTDYSSSFFDYAVTGRPMVFYTYDLERYRGDVRGHYVQMEDVVPGPVVATAAEVAEALHDVETDRPRYADRYRAFRSTYNPWEDGGAAARVVDAVFR